MPKQSILIFSMMLIVFSLTLMGGGGSYMFYVSPGIADKTIQTALFWAGALVGLFGLAGLLAGLVGVMSAAIIRAAEAAQAKEELETQEETTTGTSEQEIA